MPTQTKPSAGRHTLSTFRANHAHGQTTDYTTVCTSDSTSSLDRSFARNYGGDVVRCVICDARSLIVSES